MVDLKLCITRETNEGIMALDVENCKLWRIPYNHFMTAIVWTAARLEDEYNIYGEYKSLGSYNLYGKYESLGRYNYLTGIEVTINEKELPEFISVFIDEIRRVASDSNSVDSYSWERDIETLISMIDIFKMRKFNSSTYILPTISFDEFIKGD